jgi:hypothetical protein
VRGDCGRNVHTTHAGDAPVRWWVGFVAAGFGFGFVVAARR